MEQFDAVMSLLGIMFIAIIGVYVWTFKVYKDTKNSLGDIYSSMNGHIQNNKVHVGEDGYVSSKVCDALHTSIKEDVQEIKKDVKSLLTKTL